MSYVSPLPLSTLKLDDAMAGFRAFRQYFDVRRGRATKKFSGII